VTTSLKTTIIFIVLSSSGSSDRGILTKKLIRILNFRGRNRLKLTRFGPTIMLVVIMQIPSSMHMLSNHGKKLIRVLSFRGRNMLELTRFSSIPWVVSFFRCMLYFYIPWCSRDCAPVKKIGAASLQPRLKSKQLEFHMLLLHALRQTKQLISIPELLWVQLSLDLICHFLIKQKQILKLDLLMKSIFCPFLTP